MIAAVTIHTAANNVAIKIKIRFRLIGFNKTSGRKNLVIDLIKPGVRQYKDNSKGPEKGPFFFESNSKFNKRLCETDRRGIEYQDRSKKQKCLSISLYAL